MPTEVPFDYRPGADPGAVPSIEAAAALPAERVLDALETGSAGLSPAVVAERTARFGPNAVRSHHTSALSVLLRQVSSPLLWLLLGAAMVSAFVGEGTDALIIG